jgi:group I intron endonuclease
MNSGIYQIRNIINNKRYIGSAAILTKRRDQHYHYLRNNKHVNQYLQNAYNKYGEENLIFEILENVSTDSLRDREQYYIDNCVFELYNIAPVTNSCLGIKRSDETKEKLRKANIGRKHTSETKAKITKSMYGQKRRLGYKASLETKENLSNALLGRTLTDEHRHNISISQYKPILQIDKNTDIIKQWQSATVAGRELNINNTSISACCRGERKSAGGYKWKLVDEE